MKDRYGHLSTLEKCRKHSPVARLFYIFLVFSNIRRVLPHCIIHLRRLYLLNVLFNNTQLGPRSLYLLCIPIRQRGGLSASYL